MSTAAPAVHRYGPPGGRPLLLIHGVTNTGRRFRRLAEEELPGRRVLAPDLAGHGDSSWYPPWHAERLVDDLAGLLDEAAADGPVEVAGHSFGGLLAMMLAARAPERVGPLVLIDPAVALDPVRAAQSAEAMRADESWESRDEAAAARRALRPPHARDTVDEDLEGFLAAGSDGRWRLRYSRAAALVAWSEMARPVPSLGDHAGPVMLIEARGADFVTDALRTRLRAECGPRLREEGIDAGHMLFWDARAELGALLREALGS